MVKIEGFNKYRNLIIADIDYLGTYFVNKQILEKENITFECFVQQYLNGTYKIENEVFQCNQKN